MKGRKHNIPMCMALVLLCLTMITTHMTGGLYARYTTTASGSDSARVAKFDVQCNVTAVEGTTDQFNVTVTNNSDVTVEYTLEVLGHVQNDAAKVVKLSAKIGDKALNDASYLWTLLSGQSSDPHTITLAPEAWTEITQYMDNTAGGDVNVAFTVNVHAEQVN